LKKHILLESFELMHGFAG